MRSFKRLRDFFGVRETKVCSACPKAGVCPFAHKIPNTAYDGDVQDVFNVLLAYGQLADRIDPDAVQNIDKHLEKLWDEERKAQTQHTGQEGTQTEPAESVLPNESLRLARDYGLKFQSCMITLRTFDKLLTDLEVGLDSERRLQESQTQTTPGKKKSALKVDFPLQKFDNAIREYEAAMDRGDQRTELAKPEFARVGRNTQPDKSGQERRPSWRDKFNSPAKRDRDDDSITGLKTEKRAELQRKLKEEWTTTPQVIEGDRLYKRPKESKDSYMDKVRLATSKVVESNFMKTADPQMTNDRKGSPRYPRSEDRESRRPQGEREFRERPAWREDRRPKDETGRQRDFSEGRYKKFEDSDGNRGGQGQSRGYTKAYREGDSKQYRGPRRDDRDNSQGRPERRNNERPHKSNPRRGE